MNHNNEDGRPSNPLHPSVGHEKAIFSLQVSSTPKIANASSSCEEPPLCQTTSKEAVLFTAWRSLCLRTDSLSYSGTSSWKKHVCAAGSAADLGWHRTVISTFACRYRTVIQRIYDRRTKHTQMTKVGSTYCSSFSNDPWSMAAAHSTKLPHLWSNRLPLSNLIIVQSIIPSIHSHIVYSIIVYLTSKSTAFNPNYL